MFCNCNPNAVIKCFYHVILTVVLEPCVSPMTVSCRNSITAGHIWYQHSFASSGYLKESLAAS